MIDIDLFAHWSFALHRIEWNIENEEVVLTCQEESMNINLER